MLSNTTFVVATLCMGLVTFILRAAPTMIPKLWLQSDLLRALNRALPLCVMVILTLVALPLDATDNTHLPLLAQLVALVLVLLSYIKFRNVLVAMVVGVASLNGLLWLLDAWL